MSVFPSVTSSSSSHTIQARGLKFGMRNSYINGSNVANQIFDIFFRSRDI